MNAIEYLSGQHREVEELFDQFEKSNEAGKLDLLEQIADTFAMHAELEEKIFYPACQKTELKDQIEESLEEHEEVKLLIAEAVEMDEEELITRMDDLATRMRAAIDHHVQEEEDELFPRARDLLGNNQLDQLQKQMEAMSEELAAEDEPLAEKIVAEVERPAPM